MLLLLPPSETKRDGGAPDTALDLGVLSFSELTRPRRRALAGLRSLSRSVSASMIALKLGQTQRFEIDRNRAISTSPVMPAIDRYTGVLYDALGADTLDASARVFIAETTVIHSALFGLIGAVDLVPAYRFSHNTQVPGLALKSLWRAENSAALQKHGGLVLDLRSESYAHLGPAPVRDESFFVRVVAPGTDGVHRALNHFNKKGKGEFVRALALVGERFDSADELLSWAAGAGIQLERGAPGELNLIVLEHV